METNAVGLTVIVNVSMSPAHPSTLKLETKIESVNGVFPLFTPITEAIELPVPLFGVYPTFVVPVHEYVVPVKELEKRIKSVEEPAHKESKD